MDGRQLARIGVARQKEIDEAGAGNLGAGDERVGGQGSDDRLRQLARIAPRGFGEAHGNVRGEVAVLGVLRAVHDDHARGGRFREQARGKMVQGGQHELFELLLQGVGSGGWKAPEFTRTGSRRSPVSLPARLHRSRCDAAAGPTAAASP